jgi:hypothetical protein
MRVLLVNRVRLDRRGLQDHRVNRGRSVCKAPKALLDHRDRLAHQAPDVNGGAITAPSWNLSRGRNQYP